MSLAEFEASPNTNITFPCNVSLNEDQRDVSLMKVKWIRNGSDVASFGETATMIQNGFRWNNESFINGDFSITLLKASLTLQGVYECTVIYNSSSIHTSNVTFSITGMSSSFLFSFFVFLKLQLVWLFLFWLFLLFSAPLPDCASEVGGAREESSDWVPCEGLLSPTHLIFLDQKWEGD